MTGIYNRGKEYAAMAKPADKRRRPRLGIPMFILILVLLAAAGWQLHNLRAQVEEAKAEQERYAQAVAEQKQENEALAQDIAEGPTDEKMQEIAREELDMVTPGEYVFQERN